MPYTMPRQLMDMKALLMRSHRDFSDKYISSLYRSYNSNKQQEQQRLQLFAEDISVPQMINATLAN